MDDESSTPGSCQTIETPCNGYQRPRIGVLHESDRSKIATDVFDQPPKDLGRDEILTAQSASANEWTLQELRRTALDKEDAHQTLFSN